jgi:hypothetical protein
LITDPARRPFACSLAQLPRPGSDGSVEELLCPHPRDLTGVTIAGGKDQFLSERANETPPDVKEALDSRSLGQSKELR